jgi:transposase-like protein
MSILSKPYFHDEAKAYEHLEAVLWPDGPVCPHCGVVGESTKLKGEATRPGLYKCNACRKQHRVTVGTVFESAHIPLPKMLQAVYLMTASKKGISAHQMHRTLEITYKSAWFLCHRIREAMCDGKLAPMGGAGQIVEMDETAQGRVEGAPKHSPRRTGQWARTVFTLVERGGSARSFHVEGTTIGQLVPIIRANIRRESAVMTDEASWYKAIGKEFARHGAVEHGAFEYVRGDVTPNTVEGYFSIFKRGMRGVYQHCSEKHLHRYLAEFDFRYSNRVALGINDAARAQKALNGIKGKRLYYRETA